MLHRLQLGLYGCLLKLLKCLNLCFCESLETLQVVVFNFLSENYQSFGDVYGQEGNQILSLSPWRRIALLSKRHRLCHNHVIAISSTSNFNFIISNRFPPPRSLELYPSHHIVSNLHYLPSNRYLPQHSLKSYSSPCSVANNNYILSNPCLSRPSLEPYPPTFSRIFVTSKHVGPQIKLSILKRYYGLL